MYVVSVATLPVGAARAPALGISAGSHHLGLLLVWETLLQFLLPNKPVKAADSAVLIIIFHRPLRLAVAPHVNSESRC